MSVDKVFAKIADGMDYMDRAVPALVRRAEQLSKIKKEE